MNEMISIIMPTYNRGYIIKHAVESVLSQTYKVWELIVVDDGSTDDTNLIVNSFEESRIKYIKIGKNMGANHARNIGISSMRGDFVCFLDSDNFMVNNCLEKRLSFISEKNVDFIWSRFNCVYLNGILAVVPSESVSALNDREYITKKHMLYGLIDTNSVFLRKELCKEIGNFDENLPRLQDKEYFIRILAGQQYKIAFLDECLVTSKLQKNSISLNSRKLWDAYVYILKKHLYVYKTIGILEEAFETLLQLENENKEAALLLINDVINEEKNDFLRAVIGCITKLKNNRKKMEWKFPRDKIPRNSRVVIYGAGGVGTSFVQQLTDTNYCKIVLWVDKNFKNHSREVKDPMFILKTEFDYIVVAISDDNLSDIIFKYLVDMGVDGEKIILLSDYH